MNLNSEGESDDIKNYFAIQRINAEHERRERVVGLVFTALAFISLFLLCYAALAKSKEWGYASVFTALLSIAILYSKTFFLLVKQLKLKPHLSPLGLLSVPNGYVGINWPNIFMPGSVVNPNCHRLYRIQDRLMVRVETWDGRLLNVSFCFTGITPKDNSNRKDFHFRDLIEEGYFRAIAKGEILNCLEQYQRAGYGSYRICNVLVMPSEISYLTQVPEFYIGSFKIVRAYS